MPRVFPVLRLLLSSAGLLLGLFPISLIGQSTAQRVDIHQLRRDLGRLAHDSLLGRNTPSPELERAAAYVADEFKAAGLKPLGDQGGYLQRYPIADAVVDPGVTVAFANGRRLQQGRDFLLYFNHNAPNRFTGPLVVLGGNLRDSSVAHLDLHGAVLVLVPGTTPKGALPDSLGYVLGDVMMSNPYAILVAADLNDSAAQAIRADQGGKSRRLDLEPLAMPGGRLYSHSILIMPPATLQTALAGTGLHLPAASRPGDSLVVLRSPKVTATVEAPHRNVARFTGQNVVGVVQGSDPKLRDEYVVFSAHLDHLGVGKPDAKGDSIYNGADDNAAGSTALLAVARAFGGGKLKHKRSILFLVTSGEEKGMWGSDYFAARPPVPLERIVADINIDGIGGPFRRDSLAVVGADSTDLGRIVREVAASHPDFRLTTGEFAPEFYRLSDNINFARRGVPSISLFSGGLFPYYHTPADQLEVIDFDWVRRVTELALDVGLAVANGDQRPRWLRKNA